MGIVHVLNGNLTRAIELARGWRRHFTSDESAELVDVAEVLLDVDESKRPYTRDELRVLDLGERLSLLTRSRPKPPRPPSPFDERIAEAEAVDVAASESYAAAMGELTAARQAQRDAKSKLGEAIGERSASAAATAESDLSVALDRAVQAEADVHIADHRLLRARSRVTALKAARSRWWAEREAMVIGRDGAPIALADFR